MKINPTNALFQFLTLLIGVVSYTVITVAGDDGTLVLTFIAGQLTGKVIDVGLIAANGRLSNGESK